MEDILTSALQSSWVKAGFRVSAVGLADLGAHSFLLHHGSQARGQQSPKKTTPNQEALAVADAWLPAYFGEFWPGTQQREQF